MLDQAGTSGNRPPIRFALLLPAAVAIAVSVHAAPAHAGQQRFHAFPPTPVMAAYPSELRSTVNRFELQLANKAPPQYPWAAGYEKRPLVNIQLGIELPVIGFESDRWSWYIGFPVAFDLMNDFFETDSAPVINTDYWFGLRAEALRRFETPWPGNMALRFLPVYHESTHLGDEFSLRIADQTPDDYYRINLSYEAWEAAIGFDEWERDDRNAFNLRLGLSGKWNTDGYYSPPHPSELGTNPETSGVVPSRSGMEYFGQFNLVVTEGFPSADRWVFQWGLEARNRILLDYFASENEERVWTVSSAIGWYRYPEGLAGRRLGCYMRVLGGQNPHGQFREQNGYFVVSAGFSLGT